MAAYNYNINPRVYTKIEQFYKNVSIKYCHTYSMELMQKNMKDAYLSIFRIENGSLRLKPTNPQWEDKYMAHEGKWYFAYRIDGDTIYVDDACHSQNMKESKEYEMLRIYEQMLKLNSITNEQFQRLEIELLVS